jgi:hypothetical protein
LPKLMYACETCSECYDSEDAAAACEDMHCDFTVTNLKYDKRCPSLPVAITLHVDCENDKDGVDVMFIDPLRYSAVR